MFSKSYEYIDTIIFVAVQVVKKILGQSDFHRPTKSETIMPGMEYRIALLALMSSHPIRPTTHDELSSPRDMMEEGQR